MKHTTSNVKVWNENLSAISRFLPRPGSSTKVPTQISVDQVMPFSQTMADFPPFDKSSSQTIVGPYDELTRH